MTAPTPIDHDDHTPGDGEDPAGEGGDKDAAPSRSSSRTGHRALAFEPPSGWTRVRTIDAHAAGEPLRVIVDGFPDLGGSTILERRRRARARYDALRTALMWEPRGHADMYGCVLTEPTTPGTDFGVLFLHNEGYSTMCGHGIIAVSTVLLATGVVHPLEPETPLTFDTPAGLVRATARVAGGEVGEVRFVNVPSFVVDLDAEIDAPGVGRVRYDLAFGGAFYAVVDAERCGLRLTPDAAGELARAGMSIKRAVQAARAVEHPLDPELSFLYGTIFVGPAAEPGAHSRNACVFAEGEVDRSPTGTGVSARLAIHRARGELGVDDVIVVESLLGTRFTGRVVDDAVVGAYAAVVPEVGGRAWITGRHEFWIDPTDPLAAGFLLR